MNTDSPIGLFRQDITDPKHLAATTIARDHLINDVLEKLENRGDKKSGLNHLFIGPRGIGKTHLLSLLAQGLASNDVLKKQYTLIRFPEESNRLLSFADLLLGILDRLVDIEEGEQKKQLKDLYQQLETEENDEEIIDYIVPRLKLWHKQTGKVLVIMLENMDVLFTQQIKNKKDIHRIRSLLMDNSHILLIGSAPTFFPALNDVKHPLYDFFDIQVIEELNQQQTLSLVKSHFEWDNRDDLLQQFEELKPRLLAMHTLTGGNPRLIMTLYELIAQDNLSDIITRFHQLLDKITPFYQDRIKDLPPQERALLETIALMRTEQRTPVNIAKKFRKSRKQTSVLLKRMTEAGYLTVSPNPDDNRSRLYRIKEGFFDIWLAMNESRANRKHMPFLVNFLSLWYASQQERENKRQQLTQQLNELKQQGKNNALKVLDYLAEVSPQTDEKQQTKVELAVQHIKIGDKQSAIHLLDDAKNLIPLQKDNGMMIWVQDKASQWCESEQNADEVTRMENIINYWQVQRSGELEKASELFHELKLDFSSHGLHQLHIALLTEQLEKARQDKNKKLEGVFLNNISLTYNMAGDRETALEYLEKSLVIDHELGDKQGEGTTLNNISQIHDARGDYETALKYLEQSLAIRQEIGDKSGEGTTLNNISQIFKARGNYETALKYLEQSLAIQQEIGDKSGEGTTLNNISQIHHAQGDYETALKYLEQSLAIQQEIGDVAALCATVFNMGHIHKQNKAIDDAMSAWLNVYKLAKPMQLAQALDTLSNLAPKLGMPEGLEGWEALLKQQESE